MVPHKPSRKTSLEVNDVDHHIRCYGGTTVALEMEPHSMQSSKDLQTNSVEDLEFLTRRIGELRLETAFYRECFQHSEKFKDTISSLSQELLHQCIFGLLHSAPLDKAAQTPIFNEIKKISTCMSTALEELVDKQNKAFSTFISPYKARLAYRPKLSRDSMI